jgi:DNA-binding response OmpR family regulator/predicted regulator of Ras-like GTPase activity (Roadblock/LC7/MglB family)
VAPYSILIADGDPDLIQYLSGVLRANGFSSSSTSSGIDALELYKNETPDLVVADLATYDLDGMELLEALRSFDPNARVILTAAVTDKDMIARAFRLGALDILEKPLDSEFFISKIRDLLSREDRALEGTLRMMSLASIIQINCEERNLARLTLNHLGREGRVFFKDGEVIHAEIGGIAGEEAIYALLRWEDGNFKLRMGVEPPQRSINKPWSGILLEGMRRIDESTAEWNVEWEEDESPAEDDHPVQERIIKAISNIRDVDEALISSLDGTVIAQESNSDLERNLVLSGIIHEQAELIGGFLEGGEFDRAVLTGADHRFYVQNKDELLINLILSKRSSAESVYASIETIHKRYQSAD